MFRSSVMPKWLRLPSRIALLLGIGALSAAKPDAAEAHVAPDLTRAPQQSAKTFGELRIWSDDGRVYVAEAGKPARELHLGDTAEARRLRQLLERDGASSEAPRVLVDRMILVGGGGDGFHWAPPGAPPGRGNSPDQAGSAASTGRAGGPAKAQPKGQAAATSRTGPAGTEPKR
jgi:hypothetical protein